jgi:hypothetical protein
MWKRSPQRTMPTPVELDDADKAALIAEVKRTIAADPFPMSPRVRTLRGILEKLQPPSRRAEPYPAPKPAGTPSLLLARKKGRR